MKSISRITLIFAFLIPTGFYAFPQTGTLDTSFDGDGIAMYAPGTDNDVARDIIALTDTTMLVCGTFVPSGTNHTAGLLMKVLEDGSIDTTFGNSGIVTMQYGNNTYAYDMELQPDGKIVVAGICYLSSGNSEMFAARFDSTGNVDSGFGNSGYFLGSYSSEEDNCYALTLQSDGKIVLGGATFEGAYSKLLFARLDTDGTLDGTFGTSGYTEIDASIQGEQINALDILSDGTIVGIGYGYESNPLYDFQVYMAELDTDGQPVSGFGTDGVMVPSVFTRASIGYGMYLKNDTLYVTGYQEATNGDYDLFIAKIDADGNADEDFGTDGITLTNINMYNVGYDVYVAGDHKIYVNGTSGLPGVNPRDFIILRYKADGTLDPAWNGTGYTLTTIRPDWDASYANDMQRDGKMVVAGFSSGGGGGNNDLVITRYKNDFNPFYADFTADQTTICSGSTVNFTDLSGLAATWSWTFEGGTPATSTDQNPSVTYNAGGTYDVTLTITDGYGHSTSETKEDYISVLEIPDQADAPDGDAEICTGYTYEYTTSEVLYASDYEWELDPPAAGTLTVNMNSATLDTDEDWTGDFTLRVRATNMCGDGDWSDYFEGTIFKSPESFNLEGGGSFCDGGDGVEITLSGSETGVTYELYVGGDPTGITAEGTGSEISFGLVTEGGYYTAIGTNDHCSFEMDNQVLVTVLYAPEPPALPTGDTTVCHTDVTDYNTAGSDDADDYNWYLDPGEAGTITGNGLNATVEWNEDFAGTAYITVTGINDCGEGDPSDALEVTVEGPTPEITGEPVVCDNTDENYEVEDHEGSTYNWEVTGGNITDGQGTHSITVHWNDAGNGSVSVGETTENGCSGTGELDVLIDDCTGMTENNDEAFEVYPNPAGSFLNINLVDKKVTKGEIIIFNQTGQTVIRQSFSGPGTIRVSLADLTGGMYFIRIKSENRSTAPVRFIKN